MAKASNASIHLGIGHVPHEDVVAAASEIPGALAVQVCSNCARWLVVVTSRLPADFLCRRPCAHGSTARATSCSVESLEIAPTLQPPHALQVGAVVSEYAHKRKYEARRTRPCGEFLRTRRSVPRLVYYVMSITRCS